MITAGLDIGSRTTKAVVLAEGRIAGSCLVKTGWLPSAMAREALSGALFEAGLRREQVERLVATGYGRIHQAVAELADEQFTEIACHARGMNFHRPEVRTLVDIGGQDSKVIRLDATGLVMDFAMNDRCAAGTGKFLEMTAQGLDLPLDRFIGLALQARSAARISSMCTVFAESEAISLLAEGREPEEIARGLHNAIAARVARMAETVGVETEVGFSGGVGNNAAMIRALEEALGLPVVVPPRPEFTGALGAALLAGEL
ncbi:MAG: 2-hydroxyglutaryl-CoA dehydratase [Candidatus Zixiibacteriota bacterium]|nr:MAG: 2-hydroxyglutaryl-CoA dehydratase [candidate division Zixibacteria bacterium]